MNEIVIECRSESSADYWWNYTLEVLYSKKIDISKLLDDFGKYPVKYIKLQDLTLYFISTYKLTNFVREKHNIYSILDTDYENIIYKVKESVDFSIKGYIKDSVNSMI